MFIKISLIDKLKNLSRISLFKVQTLIIILSSYFSSREVRSDIDIGCYFKILGY